MIEKIPDQIPVQTGEWRGTTFDIIPKETFGMACRKINEIVDTVNELQESQNTYWTDIAELKKELQTRSENVQPDAESRSENVQNELERTRKALDIALNCLNGVGKGLPWVKRTLDEITALEQKE